MESDWMQAMGDRFPQALASYSGFRESILADGALSRKEKELLLVAIDAARRYEAGVLANTRDAIAAGATVQELAEILLPVVLARGIPAWLTGVNGIRLAEELRPAESGTVPAEADVDESPVDYLMRALGHLPAWAEALKQYHPTGLAGYALLRRAALREGVVPPYLKELVLMAVNAAERYEHGAMLHVRGAVAAGATQEQIGEAMLVAALAGGIPAWLIGYPLLDER